MKTNAQTDTFEAATLEELAERFQVNVATLRRYTRKGLLPARKIGRKVWVSAQDWQRFMSGGSPGEVLPIPEASGPEPLGS